MRMLNVKMVRRIGFLLTVIVCLGVLLRDDADKKVKRGRAEYTIALGEITREIYVEKKVYVELLVRKAKRAFLESETEDGEEKIKIKITLFFSQEKMEALTQEGGGNLSQSKTVVELLQYAFQKVKTRFPEVREDYEASVKVIPVGLAQGVPETEQEAAPV